MAWSEADAAILRAAILAAITSGNVAVKSVSYADRVVVYRDISDMLSALAQMEATVVETADVRTVRFAAFSKGTGR
jgi:hypothetical protein